MLQHLGVSVYFDTILQKISLFLFGSFLTVVWLALGFGRGPVRRSCRLALSGQDGCIVALVSFVGTVATGPFFGIGQCPFSGLCLSADLGVSVKAEFALGGGLGAGQRKAGPVHLPFLLSFAASMRQTWLRWHCALCG